MNRSKYAILTLKLLEKYPKAQVKISDIDRVIVWDFEACPLSELDEISRGTKRRALNDLIELGFVSQSGKKYRLEENELQSEL